jgi:hypothetical protein
MDWLFGSLAILIAYPLLAVLLGVVLLALGSRARRRTAVLCGIIWVLYGVYEIGMQKRWLCTGECNIRVDLLLIDPVLVLTLIAALVSLARSRKSRRA